MDELKASVGGLALSPSLVSPAQRRSRWRRVRFCLTSLSSLPPSLRPLVEEKSGKCVSRHPTATGGRPCFFRGGGAVSVVCRACCLRLLPGAASLSVDSRLL